MVWGYKSNKKHIDEHRIPFGTILLGISHLDRRDLFAILEPAHDGFAHGDFDIKCLTRRIGWGDNRSTSWWRNAHKPNLGSGSFCEYSFSVLENVTLDNYMQYCIDNNIEFTRFDTRYSI